MTDSAFDTLGAARRLKVAGMDAEHAEAIVEVMGESVNQLVTMERFDAGLAMLHTRLDALESGLHARIDSVQTELHARIDAVEKGLHARIDAVQTELHGRIDGVQTESQTRIDTVVTGMRAEIARSILVLAGFVIAANALMMTILGVLLT